MSLTSYPAFTTSSNETTKAEDGVSTKPTEIPASDTNLNFLIVPLAVLVTIMLLSAMVYMMARNRRKINNFYKRVQVPSFTFETSDLEDNDDPTECLLAGKLHIDNNYDSYQIHTYNEKSELFT